MRMPRQWKTRATALFMAAALCAGLTPSAFAAEEKTDKLADPATYNDYNDMLGDAESTRYNCRVWSDKTVSEDSITFTATGGDELQDAEGESIGKKYTVNTDASKGEDFLVTFSTLATSMEVTDTQSAPVDAVFVLDFSNSMNWATDREEAYVDGTPDAAEAQEHSRLQALVDSLNETIDALVTANDQNRIGIVVFNGTAKEMFALGNVTPIEGDDPQYLTISRFDEPAADSEGRWETSAAVTCRINGSDQEFATGSGTNIEAGLYLGMKQLAEVSDTEAQLDDDTVVTRKPFVVLMSDGAPTTFSSASDAYWEGIAIQNTEDYNKGDHKTGGPLTIFNSKDGSTNLRDFEPLIVTSGSWWDGIDYQQAIGRGDVSSPD